jgi:hypothetical protein
LGWGAGSAFHLRSGTPLSKKAKLELYEDVARIFHLAGLEAEPIGHHLQTATQFPVAFFHVFSYFATFEWCNRRISDPPPSYPLPFLQLSYFETKGVRLSHVHCPLLKKERLLLIPKNH